MSNLTSVINVNVDSNLKKEASNILNGLGLNMSTAINMFLTQVVKRDGIPFEITNPKPSKMLLEALIEAEEIEKGKIKVNTYDNREDLKQSLLKDE